MDKNEAVIQYLITCPKIENSPLYFNFISAKDNHTQIITSANDKSMNRRYIDGSVLRLYTFSIIEFKAIAYNPIVKLDGYSDENVEDMYDAQGLVDWIEEQNNLRNFPNFGENCVVEEIRTTTDNPVLDAIDASAQPALAQYSLTIEIQYLDKSKMIWQNE